MQPYFFPYIGYFQLIAAVDLFIVHDRVKYTKKGWINRNRILQFGKEVTISLPLKNASDALDIVDRQISPDFNRDKLLNRIGEAYRKAPCFDDVFALLQRIVHHEDPNLSGFLQNSLAETCGYLGIGTRMTPSSQLAIDESLAGQDKLLALCRQAGANTYVNAIGGMELYSPEAFRSAGIELRFLQSRPFEYSQFGGSFVPSLSIVDAMMFNPVDALHRCLTTNYDLIERA